jgi:paraquat-inducible protein B
MPAESTPPPPADELPPQPPPPPRVEERNRLRLSLVWLVPLVAVAVGLVLVVRHWMQTGPDIEIEFRTAEGVEAGKTEVRYKEVPVGKVTQVVLAPDRQRVLVSVQLDKSATNMAVEDTRFWVVRPRVGVAGISGLGTLLSGAYIGVDAGVKESPRRQFTGLEVPPFVLRNEPGRSFVLTAQDLGSLDIGSPVYYKRTRVGRVVGYSLDPKLDVLSVSVFVESPHEALVTTQSRFWNASGLDFAINSNGVHLNTQSLASVIAGGVAFANPPNGPEKPPSAAEGTRFTLFSDEPAALAPPDGPALPVRMVFPGNTRGLGVGAPIETLGVEVGRVAALRLRHDPARQRFSVEVDADLYPRRLGLTGQPGMPDDPRALMKLLVERGLRAQLRNGSLLTGQMYVGLDFLQRDNPAATLDASAARPTLPTVPSAFGNLQPQLMAIVKRLSNVKFDEIGSDLQSTLRAATGTMKQLTPEAQAALADVRRTLERAQGTLGNADRSLQQLDRNLTGDDANLQRNANQTLDELQRTARALRALADYLQRHPESLLRGKPADVPFPDPYTKP